MAVQLLPSHRRQARRRHHRGAWRLSAASAANAAIDHMYSWIHGTPEGEWVTAGVMSDGTHYGVPAGLNFGFPVTSDGGEWQVVDGLEISDATRAGIDHNIKALQEEYDAVKALGFIK